MKTIYKNGVNNNSPLLYTDKKILHVNTTMLQLLIICSFQRTWSASIKQRTAKFIWSI